MPVGNVDDDNCTSGALAGGMPIAGSVPGSVAPAPAGIAAVEGVAVWGFGSSVSVPPVRDGPAVWPSIRTQKFV